MAIYYVDGDNSPKERIKGIEWLSENDKVYIFYADTNTYYTKDKNRRDIELTTKAKIQFEKTGTGKNATDFAIAVHAAMALDAAEDESLFLVSGDKHFTTIGTFLKRFSVKKFSVKCVDVIWKGIIDNYEQIDHIEIIESILKEKFGNDEGKKLYFVMQELLYQKFRREEGNRKTKWNIIDRLKRAIAF